MRGTCENPNVVFSAPAVECCANILPGELPITFRFLTTTLFAVVTTVVARAMRITEVNVTVLAAVF